MALCLFAAGALAIPGFAARADNNDGPLPIPNTTFVINLENASEFEAEYGKTGYWGVILDNGGVTPTAPLTFERSGETVTVTADGLWKVNALDNYRMVVPVPNGANNGEHVTWEPGSSHWVTVVIYQDDKTLAKTFNYSVKVFEPSSPSATAEPTPEPTADPTVAPAPESPVSPAPESPVSPAPESPVSPAPAPQPDDPQLPVVQPTATSSASPSATPSASASPEANATQPSDTPVSPVSDVSELTDANKGGVSAAFTGGQLTINVPSDKAGAGEWVSANIMQTGEARWLQVEDGNKVTMDVAGLPMGEYKVVVANRSHQLVGWADFKVASTVGAAGAGASVDASGSVKLHAEVLSSSNAADESEGLNGYLLGAGACMLILGGLVVLQVLSGPKIGSSSQGVTLT
ncbi:MAG: type IV secretion protein Rhs [Actinomyces sp.]|nr:type IV secretion protein Rhs [Actinomyces sp.]